MQLSCPSAGRLREFLEGSVGHAEANQISDHVGGCPSCDRVISALESEQGEVTQRLREGLKVGRLLDEPEFQELRKTGSKPPNASTIGTSHAAEDHPSSGTRLRDYRLVKKIGEGGMGTVYQAVHVHLGKAVALKILPTDKLQSKQSVVRFKQEMRSVGKVNHPNVISASDAGSVDGMHFLVMELVEGADLARIIHDLGILGIADACEIVRQAALGLQHAHDNGLVHRDVKPSNLMLALDGSVKVLDLGLAGLNNATIEPTANVVVTDRLTSVGQIMGTLDYMAPEQIMASTQVDHRADIYALGATTFQLLTGKTPCGNRADETPRRIEAVLHGPPTDVTTLRKEVPSGLSRLLNRMLSKSPHDRPKSAKDVADELSSFVANADLNKLAEACRTSCATASADVDVTDDVSFIVSRAASPGEAISIKSPKRQRWAWQLLVLTITTLLLAALLSTVVFRTQSGTVEVAFPSGADSADVRLELSKDGKSIRVIEKSGRWTVDVKAGQYDVQLLSGSDRFEVVDGVLTVKSGETSVLQIRSKPLEPSIEDVFRRGQYQRAAELAEQEAVRNPEDCSNHGRAAVMWLHVSVHGRDKARAKERYEHHRKWLAGRWARTGEASRTVPRICCMRVNPPGDLDGMLTAIVKEAKQYPQELWQYSHSRMMVLYRLGKYDQALAAFRECRALAPRDPMRAAVDHLWSAIILNRLGRAADGNRDLQRGLQMLDDSRPRDGKPVSSKLFDFVESHAMLEEASNMNWHVSESADKVETSIPFSACLDDFRLMKLKWCGEEISDVTMTPDGRTAMFALGWRPGTYEVWDLSKLKIRPTQQDFDDYLVESQVIQRKQGGQPVQSVAIHRKNRVAALGRWYGAVDIIDLESHDVITTYIQSDGKARKANGVAFSNDGDVLLIGYQSARLVAWDWKRNKVIRQKIYPKPVWEVRVSPRSDEALMGGQIGQIWNWSKGESRELRSDVNHAGAWNIDGDQALLLSGNQLYVFDVESGRVLDRIPYNHPINSHVVLKKANRVITGHYNGDLRLTDLAVGKSVLLAQTHRQHRVGFLEIDDANRVLLTASGKRINARQGADRQIAVWSLSEELQTRSLDELEQQHAQSFDAGTQRRFQFDKWRQSHTRTRDSRAQPGVLRSSVPGAQAISAR